MKAWLSRYGLLVVIAIFLIVNNIALGMLYVRSHRAERELEQLKIKTAKYLSLKETPDCALKTRGCQEAV